MNWRPLLLAAALVSPVALAEEPPLAEVAELVRTHLPEVSADTLQAGSVTELLGRLGGRARLLEEHEEPVTPDPPPVEAEVLEGRYAWLRLGTVGADIAARTLDRLTALRTTNSVAGCVLDLRFAGGRDFGAAAALAGLFLPPGTPLFDAGDGMVLSSAPTNRFDRPLAVLINSRTHGAAEALAHCLAQSGPALLVGDSTAGDAPVTVDLPLSTGQRLRLAVARLRLPSGGSLPSSGVAPDLRLPLDPTIERAYLRDPFTAVRSLTNSPAATNSITTSVRVRRRLTEADLVRERAQAGQEGTPEPEDADAPPAPVVRDPVLARGLDFLKGQSLIAPE